MPTYQYLCDRCGAIYEVEQGIKEDPYSECNALRARILQNMVSDYKLESMTDDALLKTAKENDISVPDKTCQGSIERIISSTSFVLKGGRWYKDGYSNAK